MIQLVEKMIHSAVVVVLCTIISVKANYTLEILMVSYSNPLHLAQEHINFRHGCCERDAALPCEACDNAFNVCIRETPTRERTGNCDFGGEKVSSRIEENDDNLVFTIGESVGGLSNPIVISGEMWQETVEVVFNIYDVDITADIDSSSDVVDNIFIYPDVEANESFSDSVTFTGNANISQLELAFRLTCGQDYYGPDCTYCIPTNDSTGHYICDAVAGEKVCLEGYQDPDTDCQNCTPSESCSSEGGHCKEPGDCICNIGYKGDNCELHTLNVDLQSQTKIYASPSTMMMSPSSTPLQAPSDIMNGGLSTGIVIAIISLAFLLILVVMVVLTWLIAKKRVRALKKHKRDSDDVNYSISAPVKLGPQPQVSNRSLLSDLQKDLSSKHMLYQRHHVELGAIVGQGETGVVYRGYISRGQGKELVAIKTGKALLSAHDRQVLLEEVSTMLSFKHPNIMSLIGLCFDEGMPLLIMPFMTKGTLLKYVKDNRETLYIVDQLHHEQVKAARSTCFSIFYQIARGMVYLANNKFVHRDLAARNCMIDNDGVIKVADFGLTKEMYATNYYRQNEEDKESGTRNEERVPIRWMAPESIEGDLYNEKTDVWSFGVTCWEVMTCGGVPYAGVHILSILRELRAGHRLDRPSNIVCSDEIWEMVMACWSESPKSRPQFGTLEEEISKFLQYDSVYITLTA